jgi:hypothetical protein
MLNMARRISFDVDLLQAALVGLQYEASRIDEKIAEVRARLGGSQKSVTPDDTTSARKRILSASARKRIAAAQRKRWATYRKEGQVTGPGTKIQTGECEEAEDQRGWQEADCGGHQEALGGIPSSQSAWRKESGIGLKRHRAIVRSA